MSAYSSINLEILNTSLDFYLGHFYINVDKKVKTKTQIVTFYVFFARQPQFLLVGGQHGITTG